MGQIVSVTALYVDFTDLICETHLNPISRPDDVSEPLEGVDGDAVGRLTLGDLIRRLLYSSSQAQGDGGSAVAIEARLR